MTEHPPGRRPAGSRDEVGAPGNVDAGWSIPRRARPPVRWGLGDFFIVFTVGIVGATIAAAPFVEGRGSLSVRGLVASLAGQSAAILLALVAVTRWKGRGSLHTDLGLAVRVRDARWLLVGLAFSLVAGVALLPIVDIAGKGTSQEVVKQLERARGGPEQILFALGVVVLAPLVEELVYRGLLLRSLLRRTTPAWAVSIGAAVFGLAHVAGDPGSYAVLPALVALGALSGILAVRGGDISRSIFLHAGFNLLTTVEIVAVVRLAGR